jgi:hypothetical protein
MTKKTDNKNTNADENKTYNLLDFCKPAEAEEVTIDYKGKKLKFKIREFMSSDREHLADMADEIGALHKRIKAVADANEKIKDKKKHENYILTARDTLLLQKYKAKQAWLLLVDDNGMPLFRSMEDMMSKMRPDLIDVVATEVEKHLSGGAKEAEKH